MPRPKNKQPSVILNVRINQDARDKTYQVDKYKIGQYISDLIMNNPIKEQFKAKQ